MERLHLDDRVEQFNQGEAFVILKDHKENFQINTECRLPNPAKSEIGIISKHYIDKIYKNNEYEPMAKRASSPWHYL